MAQGIRRVQRVIWSLAISFVRRRATMSTHAWLPCMLGPSR